MRRFRTVLSVRALFAAHSSSLELHALLLAIKWITRARSRFHHRLPIFADAKAIICAAAKGRTGAPALRRTLQHIAALALGADILMRLVYIPTESNPSDAPSRGL